MLKLHVRYMVLQQEEHVAKMLVLIEESTVESPWPKPKRMPRRLLAASDLLSEPRRRQNDGGLRRAFKYTEGYANIAVRNVCIRSCKLCERQKNCCLNGFCSARHNMLLEPRGAFNHFCFWSLHGWLANFVRDAGADSYSCRWQKPCT